MFGVGKESLLRLARFHANGRARYGLIEGEEIVELEEPYYERIVSGDARVMLTASYCAESNMPNSSLAA